MADGKSYFTDGEAYERLMGRWSRAAGAVFLDWLSLPPGLRWADIGCGTGAFTQLLLDRCQPREVQALDPSAEQIAYARTTPAAGQANFQVGDAQSLPFGAREFDAAAMALVISFIPDPQKAVGEMERVVRPGGTVGTYMWDVASGGSTVAPLRQAIEAAGGAAPRPPGHHNANRETLQRFFEAAGLADVETRWIEIDVSYPDFDAYWDSQTGLANGVVQQLRQMTAADVERVKAHLRERLCDKSGRIAYKATASAAKGRVPRRADIMLTGI